jgi:hypothetical protein
VIIKPNAITSSVGLEGSAQVQRYGSAKTAAHNFKAFML